MNVRTTGSARYQNRIAIAGPTKTNGCRRRTQTGEKFFHHPVGDKIQRRNTAYAPDDRHQHDNPLRGVAVPQEDKTLP